MTWQAYLRFNDGGPCAAAMATNPAACTQRFPATGEAALKTRSQRRPAFARLGRLRLLATGDSQIQIIDSYLKQRLQRRKKTKVRSDAHIGTGISKPPSGPTVQCCGAAWITEYARRVQTMMRSYLRGGRSRVYWLTLPAPRGANFAEVFRAVNQAIVKAAKRFPSGVRVLDMVKVFTPGGVYRQSMVFRGRKLTVRQADGIHLSTGGASIAATLIIERLRADRLLPRPK